MRVLVTGATGLIGSAVCDALLARGDEVVGLSRDPAQARKTNPTVTWHAWDPANERPPEAAFEGVDAVVNLIGEEINQRLTDDGQAADPRQPRAGDQEPRRRHARRATPTPAVLVSQSAVGYYGDRGEAIVDESTPPATDLLGRLCAEWEAEARRAERGGVRVVGPPHRRWSSIPTAACSSSCCRRSSSASAARSPAGDSTCPGSTATTRSA